MNEKNGRKNNNNAKNHNNSRHSENAIAQVDAAISKAGRKSLFDERFILEGQRLANLGLPQRDMAFFWSVSEDSITRWKEAHPEFADALKKGEADRKIALLDAMRNAAFEKKNPAMLIFLAKNWLGMKDVIETPLSTDKPLRIEIVPAAEAKKSE